VHHFKPDLDQSSRRREKRALNQDMSRKRIASGVSFLVRLRPSLARSDHRRGIGHRGRRQRQRYRRCGRVSLPLPLLLPPAGRSPSPSPRRPMATLAVAPRC
jgi:hypothetical protein